jgi:type IV secretory pathway TrbD component
MLKNVGSADRNIRIGLGVVIIILGVALQSWWGLIGLVPLLTAGMSFCPLYTVFGISTSKKQLP